MLVKTGLSLVGGVIIANILAIGVIFLLFLIYGSAEFSNFMLAYGPVIFVLLILLGSVSFILSAMFLFHMTTKGTIEYIKDISNIVQKISDGNLGATINIKYDDELTVLAKNVNNMSIQLKGFMENEKVVESEKKELLNNISHDLRSPLTSIIAYLDMLSSGNFVNVENSDKYLKITYKKALDLNSLINQLFEFSKLDSGMIAINRTKINLVELIEQVMVGFMQKFKNNEMEYKVISEQKQIMAFVDTQLLVRAFENIIENALKYGLDGKKVDIEIKSLDEKACILISDYGTSIPIEETSKIFEKMYRIEKSRTAEGSGLGLSIAKMIIEKHKGALLLKIDEKKKTFEISLPLYI